MALKKKSVTGIARIVKEGAVMNLFDLFTRPLPQIVSESLLDRFTYLSGFLFEWQGSGFLPKKGFPLPPYQGGKRMDAVSL